MRQTRKQMLASAGFTVMELLAVVSVAGMLSSVAVPALFRYTRRASSAEAALNLNRIYDAALAYHRVERVDAAGGILPRQLPASAGPTPAGSCCAGPDRMCAPDPEAFRTPTWQALRFSIEGPHAFVYTLSSRDPGDGASGAFQVSARGDLNCDSVFSTYRRRGWVDPATGDVLGDEVIHVESEND